MKNWQLIILAIACFVIAGLSANGIVQQVIHFESVINEMSFTVLAIVMGVVCIMGLDWKPKQV